MARSPGGATRPMSRRALFTVALLAALVVLAALVLRRGPGEKGEEAAREAPIVAPSRVREDQGEARVVLDSAEVAKVGIAVAPVQRAEETAGLRVPGEVVDEPERTAAIRAPVAGRLAAVDAAHW